MPKEHFSGEVAPPLSKIIAATTYDQKEANMKRLSVASAPNV
jgi:hypothetical protein